MIANLDELAQYIRENIPQNKAIQHLEVQATLDAVTFKWNSTEFLVRKSLDVFQIKIHAFGNLLLLSLLHLAIRTSSHHHAVP